MLVPPFKMENAGFYGQLEKVLISFQYFPLFIGRGEELSTDVISFDAASDVSMEDQKVTTMRNILKHLRNKETAAAVALMRAAREVYQMEITLVRQGQNLKKSSWLSEKLSLLNLE